MALNKSKLSGAVIWLALALFLIVSIGFPLGLTYLADLNRCINMRAEDKLALAQLLVSIFGFGGAIAAFSFAVFQYRRAERWRRTEFIAKEIKDFESDPTVQNALLMIDWGARRINLFNVPNPKFKNLVKITREVQWKALLPHPLKKKYPEYQTFPPSNDISKSKDYHRKTFTDEEAKIRDTYDVFLTRLDRFANFIMAGLISPDELRPFIIYWINAITENKYVEDVVWRYTLLTYINFYDYSGVKYLLDRYRKNIEWDSDICNALKDSIEDKILADRLHRFLLFRLRTFKD
jgi:hypothetical protein